MLNEKQIAVLLKPIKPSRVMVAQGQSHVPAYDVAAHLTRVLGFGGWDSELLSKELLFETEPSPNRWTVGYSATVRLTIKDEHGNVVAHWENGACGDAVNQPSRADAHHLAMTTAISTALKRCAAFGLGDQFGLSLYNKGSEAPLITTTLVRPESIGEAPDLESHIPIPESLGNDERQVENEEPPATTPRSAPKPAEVKIDPSQAVLATFPGTVVVTNPDMGGSPPTSGITAPPATQPQIGKIRAMLGKGADVHGEVSRIVKRDVSSLNELTKAEASHVIENLS